MREKLRTFFLIGLLCLGTVPSVFAGLVYQDFEPDNGSGQYGWPLNGAVAELSQEPGLVHSGTQSWKVSSPYNWGGTGIPSQVQTWDMDFEPTRHDRLAFWVYAIPASNDDNNVGVKFFDRGSYNADGFEVWTSRTARFRQWTRLSVLFSQLPSDFDLTRIDKIEFVNYNPGAYYFDDVQVVLQDRVYQAFEEWSCSESDLCGWAWDGEVSLSSEDEPVFEGLRSWKLVTTNNWAGTGIRSQEKRCQPVDTCAEQSPWYVDLDAAHNDRLTFWAYSLPENEMDNNLALQFFDNNLYFEDPFVLWTESRAGYGGWTKLSILFEQLPEDFELDNINKIQIQEYWPGTFYFDDIRAAQEAPEIDRSDLAEGTVRWTQMDGNGEYTLQESTAGVEGPWQTVYTGPDTSASISRLTDTWLRVNYQEEVTLLPEENPANPVGHVTDWSAIAHYQPALVVLDQESLNTGDITWNAIPQADVYEVQTALTPDGYFSPVYKGGHTVLSQQAVLGQWYRVRASKDTATGEWSPALVYDPDYYLVAADTRFKEKDTSGKTVLLKGVNLGNLFLNEPEFTGIGGEFTPDNPLDDDEYLIRMELTGRFGFEAARQLLNVYQEAYVNTYDLDQIVRAGANMVRLPVYYQLLQDEQGDFTRFEALDRVIKACADRGLYVMLDLHGAPGGQSGEIHSGRADYNRLFENTSEGQAYRDQTVLIWRELAKHYKNQTNIAGYDVLNEPYGALNDEWIFDGPNGLWTLYDQIYQTIRANDPNHIIVFEAVPVEYDWSTLPDPADYNWENIAYQLHYYGFTFDDNGEINGVKDFDEHKEYIDAKVADSRQDLYQIPVIVGEFNGFTMGSVWRYYLETFQALQWSWSVWTYKTHPDLADWGLFIHTDYNEDAVDISHDDYNVLLEKFARFQTAGCFSPNVGLTKLLSEYFNKAPAPSISEVYQRDQGNKVTLVGSDFTDTAGSVQFCADTSTEECSGGVAQCSVWNDTVIRCDVPDDAPLEGKVVVTTENGQAEAAWNSTLPVESGYIRIGRTLNRVTQKWYDVGFSIAFNDIPSVVTSLQTYNESDTAALRIKQLSSEGFQVKVEEERSETKRIKHADEKAGYVVVDPGTLLDSSGKVVGESGMVSQRQASANAWYTVTLEHDYVDPVVFMQIVTFKGGQPAHIRLRNVRDNAFEYQIEEWDYLDGKHVAESIAYVVLEKGAYRLAVGQAVEVGTESVSHQSALVQFTQSFDLEPVIISRVQTYNGHQAVVTRHTWASKDRFGLLLQEEEANDGWHRSETVGFLALEPGAYFQ